MFDVHQAQPLADRLDAIADAVEFVVNPVWLRAIFALLTALLAVWLMQSMTFMAGFTGLVPFLRLCQRCALAWLALSMILNAASPWLGAGAHQDLVGLVTDTALFVLLAASAVLVHLNVSKHHQ